MSQMTFSDYEYSLRKRKTKREEFLDIMNEIIPWEEWVEFVRPYYPNGKRGRPTKGIEKMLREDDHVAYGDSGYIGIEKRDEIKNNEHLRG